MTDLTRLTALEAAARLQRRELTAERYWRALAERIEAREPTVRAFAYLARDQALAAARALDAGAIKGPLHGVPVGIKDIFDTYDMPAQGGSKVYVGHQPTIDAASVALTRRAGAIIAGKTVTTELATFPPNETRNPHNAGHTPGGSSSGSAAAVADYMLPLATGTQTLGSIIRPAAFCGVIGYKPTYNLIPKKGFWNASDSLDTVGAFARTVPDVAFYVSAILRFDGLRVRERASPPRIGLCRTWQWDHASAEMQSALIDAGERLAAAGASVNEVMLPERFKGLLDAQITVSQFETGRSFADEVIRHGAKLRPALYERCLQGYDIAPEAYQRAIALGRECRQMLPDVLADCDVLLAPAAPGEAPKGLDSTGNPVLNQVWTFLHAPLVSLPAARGANGLPLGLQAIGRLDEDARTLECAHWIHQRLAG
jgi:Asp-tRNA(Asn)/Glu-tRNA(Gln) amidotransferase A subunit family amidase